MSLSREEVAHLKELLRTPGVRVDGAIALRMMEMIEMYEAVIRDLAKAAGFDEGKFIPTKEPETKP